MEGASERIEPSCDPVASNNTCTSADVAPLRIEREPRLVKLDYVHSKHMSSDVRKDIQKSKPSYLNDIRGSKRKAGDQTKSKTDRMDVKVGSIKTIRADDLRDESWSNNAIPFSSQATNHSAEGTGKSESLATTKDNQKKHQINWLAIELKQNEEALLERIAAGKQKQKNASMKYGW